MDVIGEFFIFSQTEQAASGKSLVRRPSSLKTIEDAVTKRVDWDLFEKKLIEDIGGGVGGYELPEKVKEQIQIERDFQNGKFDKISKKKKLSHMIVRQV